LPLGGGNGDAERRQIRCLHSHSRLGTVWLEKRKGMIGRSSNASLALGGVSKQKGLQYVCDLRNVTHNELVGQSVENIQAETSRHSAAHGALHPEFSVTFLVFLRNFVPHAPFVQDQAYFVSVAVTVQERALLGDRIFNALENRQLLTYM